MALAMVARPMSTSRDPSLPSYRRSTCSAPPTPAAAAVGLASPAEQTKPNPKISLNGKCGGRVRTARFLRVSKFVDLSLAFGGALAAPE